MISKSDTLFLSLFFVLERNIFLVQLYSYSLTLLLVFVDFYPFPSDILFYNEKSLQFYIVCHKIWAVPQILTILLYLSYILIIRQPHCITLIFQLSAYFAFAIFFKHYPYCSYNCHIIPFISFITLHRQFYTFSEIFEANFDKL